MSQSPAQLSQLDVDDPDQLVGLEALEDQHVVEAVDELRLEGAADRRHHLLLAAARTKVRRQNENGAAEVHRAALTVSQPALVENLQQHVEHIRMGLLDLVEQHHRVRPPAHRFGELTTLVVADVAGRGADKPCDGMLLAILAHVDTDHCAFVVEQEVRQRLGQFGLADAGGAEKQEGAGGPVGVSDAGPAAADGIGNGLHGLGLADDPLAEFVFHPQQLGCLTLQEPAGRDAGPRRHHIGDVVGSDLFLEHDVGLGLGLRQCRVEFLLHLGDPPVAQLGRLGQIAVTLGALRLPTEMVEFLFEGANDVDGVLLVLPARRQLGQFFFLVG